MTKKQVNIVGYAILALAAFVIYSFGDYYLTMPRNVAGGPNLNARAAYKCQPSVYIRGQNVVVVGNGCNLKYVTIILNCGHSVTTADRYKGPAFVSPKQQGYVILIQRLGAHQTLNIPSFRFQDHGRKLNVKVINLTTCGEIYNGSPDGNDIVSQDLLPY